MEHVRSRIEILDVGASLNDTPPYQPLVDAGRARITGFEPERYLDNPKEAKRTDRFALGLRAFAKKVSTGTALYPRDGRSAASLLSAANEKLRGARVPEQINPVGAMDKLKKLWKQDEMGVVHDCVIACIIGVALFVLVVIGIYISGYKLAGLPF